MSLPNIAVLGATGVVGREILNILIENDVNFVYKGFGRLRNDSFWGSMQFRAANTYLRANGKNPIDWR